MNETALATVDAQPLATIENPPEVVLLEAKKAAQALKDVIAQKARPVIMNGEQYLEFEDWQTLGRFYSITAREDGDPEYLDLGGVRGFKASAVAIDGRGREISRATAYCLNDEEKWRDRTKYAYVYHLKSGGTSVDDPGHDEIVWEDNPNKPGKKRPKKERVQVGVENVPLFQLSSMAQTRANAKALRNVLSWVVVLAGYRPTPAEEMEGVYEREQPPARTTQETSRAPQPARHAKGTPPEGYADAPWTGDESPADREPGDDIDEATAYEQAGVEPPAKPQPRKAPPHASGGKAACPQCGKMAFPSKYPKAGQTHYCGLCKHPFAVSR